jgi:hypothetical protein
MTGMEAHIPHMVIWRGATVTFVILVHISLRELSEVEKVCYTRADQQREYGTDVFSER